MPYVIFDEIDAPDRKTKVWDVLGANSKAFLGRVSWYAHWRRYCFLGGGAEIVLDATCLRELADFCETETQKHKIK